ncbi:putative amino acid transporter, partial [Trypanosoma cruzi]
MMPLVIPKHVDSLRYFSTFAVSFMIYFVVVIVVHSCTHGLPDNIHKISVSKDDDAPVVLFNSGNKAIEGLGVFMFAYVCQINSYEVYWDMTDRTLTRFTLASGLGMTLCFLLYAMVSFFGYMDFGRKVDGSILLMYDPLQEPEVMVAYVGVLSKLCASYSLLFMACRNAIYHIIGWDADELPYWKHCIAVTILSTIVLFCGLFIPKIQTVLGFAGSITAALSASSSGAVCDVLGGLDVEEGGMRPLRVHVHIAAGRVSLASCSYWCDDLGHRLRLEGNGSLYMNDFFLLFIYLILKTWDCRKIKMIVKPSNGHI